MSEFYHRLKEAAGMAEIISRLEELAIRNQTRSG
jgi:hypothetical protein